MGKSCRVIYLDSELDMGLATGRDYEEVYASLFSIERANDPVCNTGYIADRRTVYGIQVQIQEG